MVQKKKKTDPKAREKTTAKRVKTKKEKVTKRPREVKKAKTGKKAEKKPDIKKLKGKIPAETAGKKQKIKEKPEVTEEIPAEKAEEKPEVKETLKEKKIKKETPVEKIKHHGKRKLSPGEKATFRLVYKKKKRRPHFARPEHYKFKKLKDVWRRPTGIDSKQIEEKRGKPKVPKIGYKKPTSVTGVHPSGFRPLMIHNINELKKVDSKTEGAIISKTVGRKKRNEIIKLANTSGITILNPRKGEL